MSNISDVCITLRGGGSVFRRKTNNTYGVNLSKAQAELLGLTKYSQLTGQLILTPHPDGILAQYVPLEAVLASVTPQ